MLRLFFFISLIIFGPTIFAWEDHAKLTSLVLNAWRESDKSIASYLNQPVKPESLLQFLQATKTSLPAKLLEIEQWAQHNEQGYQAIPTTILYQPSHADCDSNLELCFKKSLRINLDVPLPFIIFDSLQHYLHRLGFIHVNDAHQLLPSYIPLTFNLSDFKLIPANAKVSRADVIATASMQPDFGLDTFLYENSNTAFGRQYGFGLQPLGDVTLPFHSQMLFHMSAYHEDGRIASFIPRLQENYPEYRSFLYLNLSRFAAETNHPYWAAVFLGWGLHYIQDMTQPYHTKIAYGLDVNVVLKALQETARKNDLPFFELQMLEVNRHVLLERVTKAIITTSVDRGLDKKILVRGLVDRQVDASIPPYRLDSLYLREEISNLDAMNAPDYSAILQTTLPSRYVNSPEFSAEEITDYDALLSKEMTQTQRFQFSQAIAYSLARYGVYTRAGVLAVR